MADTAGTGNTAPVLTTVTVLVFLWALVAYFIRLYVKLSQSDGWKTDDWAISAAVMAAVGQLVAICYAVHRGYGMEWHAMAVADRLAVEKSLYASQLLYIASVGAAKISASCFVAGVLARERRKVLISRVLTALCSGWTTASILAISIRGDALQPWATYNGSHVMFARWIGVEVTGYVLDLLAAVVIAVFIWNLQMKSSKKITVSALLNCRLLLVVPIVFRLYYLQPSFAGTSSTTAETIRQVIIGCNIIFSALSCLKPLLKPFDPTTFGSQHASRAGLFRYTNQERDKNGMYYELSANNGTSRSVGGGESRMDNRKDMVVQSQRSAVEGDEDELPLTDKSRPRLGVERSISKTQTWTVSVG